MHNKIPCIAQKLGQVSPDLIQSLVVPSSYTLGLQYLAEHHVRIVEADDAQIASTVLGKEGAYEQKIQLKDGNLVTKCSCPSNEQPFCRHCVAVLLEYHRWSPPRERVSPLEEEIRSESMSDQKTSVSSTSQKLREITIFIGWLQPTVEAMERGDGFPYAPDLEPGEVMGWVKAIQKFEERWRSSEEKRVALEAEQSAREVQIGYLTKLLDDTVHKVKEAQSVWNAMQRELATCQEKLSHLSDMARERDRLEDQLKAMTDDLVKKRIDVDALASSLNEISGTLQTLTPLQPQ
jgi:hypothetical protein